MALPGTSETNQFTAQLTILLIHTSKLLNNSIRTFMRSFYVINRTVISNIIFSRGLTFTSSHTRSPRHYLHTRVLPGRSSSKVSIQNESFPLLHGVSLYILRIGSADRIQQISVLRFSSDGGTNSFGNRIFHFRRQTSRSKSPSWKSNCCAASEEFMELNAHFHIHKNLPLLLFINW